MIFIVMKAVLKKPSNLFNPEQLGVINDFIKLLQSELVLSDDVYISFVEKRDSSMTTGVRRPNNEIVVLAGNRLLADILRTLSHEWVHEYQYQKMGLMDNHPVQDIGGKEENMANALSGVMVKKFVKKHPQLENILYGE
jgi:hypothetical protein